MRGVVFLGTECPVNNAYLPRLAELHRTYAPRDVQFVAVNSNQQDSAARVAEPRIFWNLPPVIGFDPALCDGERRDGCGSALRLGAVYFRPQNRPDDPVNGAHGVQYATLPDYGWERLRREKPV